MRYNIYDSTGNIVRGGFSSYNDASNWAFSRNLTNYKIK